MSSSSGFAASFRQAIEQNRLEPVGELAGLEQEHEQEHGQVELAGLEQEHEQVEVAGLEQENEQEEGGACLEPGLALEVPLRAPEPWMIGATMARVSWFWGGWSSHQPLTYPPAYLPISLPGCLPTYLPNRLPVRLGGTGLVLKLRRCSVSAPMP